MSYKKHRIAVVIPAYNEAPSIGQVVSELQLLISENTPLVDDIIVCDNASTDNTATVARDAGVREFRKGYGFACLAALQFLRGGKKPAPDYVIFVDGDHSVCADEVIDLVKKLYQGYDLVVGSRENERLESGALSPHQRFGNRLASALIRAIWHKPVSDLGPFRGMRYSSLLQLDMQDQRFGWTVEMQVKAIQAEFNCVEVPVTTRRRIGPSKISGTVRGTIGAAIGIFGKVFQLYLQESKFVRSVKRAQRDSQLVSHE